MCLYFGIFWSWFDCMMDWIIFFLCNFYFYIKYLSWVLLGLWNVCIKNIGVWCLNWGSNSSVFCFFCDLWVGILDICVIVLC